MDNVTMEPFYYQTPLLRSREKCWEDLGAYLQDKNKKGWVWLRDAPEVNSELDYDTKDMRHQGFVRGGVFPQNWDVLHIPGLGKA